eukprot:6008418-Prymnesium_polylepis.1
MMAPILGNNLFFRHCTVPARSYATSLSYYCTSIVLFEPSVTYSPNEKGRTRVRDRTRTRLETSLRMPKHQSRRGVCAWPHAGVPVVVACVCDVELAHV